MSKKPPKSPVRWKAKSMSFHPDMWRALEDLVDRNASNMSEEIRTAIRERLEKFDLWPPKNK